MIALATAVAAVLTLAASDPTPLPPPGVIDGATAQRLHARGVTVVDVRTPQEFEAGHVPGAINIPHDQMAARAAEVGEKHQPVILYCRGGLRSGLAAAELGRQGFVAVYDFQAFSAWPGPVEKGRDTRAK